jgi:hypothetical protein
VQRGGKRVDATSAERHPRITRVGRILALWACAVALPAVADDTVFKGYDAFYATLPDPLFTTADERTLDGLQSVDGQAFRAWGGAPAHGARPMLGAHRVEVLGPDIRIDGRNLPMARAVVFPGEDAAEVGADARLFVGARDVCLQGVAPTSSGTAQRHVHVRLVIDAFTSRARRYDLSSLFGSCLQLTRSGRGGVRFFAARYHASEEASQPDGIVFDGWQSHGGAFARTTASMRVVFAEPDDVYRFRRVPP